MEMKNKTQVNTFEFSGLTSDENIALVLFVLLFLVYMVTIIGNVGMVVLIYSSSILQTPMYYFISFLSIADLLYSSAVTPNTLHHLLSDTKSISFLGCLVQFYFFATMLSTELFLLSCMSYDRYVAICQPLHYSMIMTKKKCCALVLYSFSVSFLHVSIQAFCLFKLPFCQSNVLPHFYCDVPPLLSLACSDPLHCDMVISITVGTLAVYDVLSILLPYCFIISSIIKMKSSTGRKKAFSTCSSHIICVLTVFTAVFFVYVRPHSNFTEQQGKVASVFYSIVNPMLNPFIYSLRNQDVKRTIEGIIRKC